MKKFTLLDNEIKPKYESKDSLKNELFSLIDETLTIKLNSEESIDESISINGKEELVDKLKEFIYNIKRQERVSTLEHVKSNVYQNFDMKWLNEQINFENLKNTITFNWQIEYFNQKNGKWQSLKEINDKYLDKYIQEMEKIGKKLINKQEHEGIIYLEFNDGTGDIQAHEIYSNITKERDDEKKQLTK